jgi:hypothetical protein
MLREAESSGKAMTWSRTLSESLKGSTDSPAGDGFRSQERPTLELASSRPRHDNYHELNATSFISTNARRRSRPWQSCSRSDLP